ncbi:MAG: phosphotransferase [Chloroflexi bacterium]|nr:phosphotransferase [Chloroflexota bacterium]
MVKPHIDPSQIGQLLKDRFGQSVERLAPVGTGQISSAFSFSVAGKDYIVRFNTGKMAMAFGKDQLIAERLASSGIPVPPILHRGTFDGLLFAISLKYPGVPLDELEPSDYRRVIPAVIETLDTIHRIDISDTQNYGLFDDRGAGLFPSWADYLLDVANEESEEGFYGKWHWMFDETFVDREFFDRIYEQMRSLLKYCPEERFLVHADYAFGNVLAEDGKITAVLDWANSVYGDFLYDVAWLDIGYPDADYRSLFEQYYRDRGRSMPHYAERLVCYQCYICLDSMRWYGMSGKLSDYEWMRRRILKILEQN